MVVKRALFVALIVAVLCALLLVAAAQKSLQSETVLHNFGAFSGDGGLPYGGLLYKKGTLYGTTGENAPNGGSGTVFVPLQKALRHRGVLAFPVALLRKVHYDSAETEDGFFSFKVWSEKWVCSLSSARNT
jgi:hypothetical protein